MFRLRSRISLAQPAPHQLALRANPARRMLFGAVAILLVVAFIVGYDFQSGIERSALAGTIFYAVLTVTCFAVAARGTSVIFDKSVGKVVFTASIFGFSTKRQEIPSGDVRAVVIQSMRFLKESEQPRPGLLNNRFRGYIARRNAYHKLYLEFSESRRLLEDSTDLSDLEAVGGQIADFLGVDYRREEI